MEWPLVGRERELEALGTLLAGASRAGAGGADDGFAGVVIAGAAGVGKTRLAIELARRAAAREWAVESVRATRSAAGIPLGAFAAFLPAPAAGGRFGEGAELLARVRHALAERSGERRLLLCVEDGQWLDPASATLVHQLAVTGEGVVLVTVRQHEPVADAIQALWKDGLCERVDLRELTRAEVDRLVTAALGGPVDGGTLAALWELTLGNALFLRELVRWGRDRGTLADHAGIWRWDGAITPGMRLGELVGARLGGLSEPAVRALEVVAVGAPLELALLAPDERAELEALEHRELVRVGTVDQRRAGNAVHERPDRVHDRRRVVDVAHPLHGEAVRARISRTRLDAIHRRLADAVEARGTRRRGDVLRVAAWRLEAGAADDPRLFERAARHALAALDVALAARFARAAVGAGGDFDARLTLGQALAGAGDAAEAEEVLRGLAAEAGDPARAAIAVARARNLFWGLDRAADADTVLRAAEDATADHGVRGELVAQRIRLAAAAGDPRAALAAATPLLGDELVREQARLHAATGAVEALLSSGGGDAALALADRWLPIARRHRDELPWIALVLESQRGLALRLSGRLVEATDASTQVYERAVQERSTSTRAVEAGMLGFTWLARGRVRTALRLLRESAALLRDGDVAGMLPWALAGVAQAAAQAGEPALARTAVAELERAPLAHQGFAPELPLARAWSAAAAGELTGAREHAREAVELARGRGQAALELHALHELCRLGDPAAAAPALAERARHVDGPYAPLAAAHAAALVARDGPTLLDVAERFAAHAALLVAAEAADAAAAAFDDAGRASSARAAAARSAAWLAQCEGARPPTLLAAPAAAELTPREREIALLAANGLSSRAIADRLVVSVRTVDNHLQGVYRKLGVARRGDLAGALTSEQSRPAAVE